MDYNRIKDLLEKYLDAETSIAEEKELKDFFLNNENIPQELAYAKSMFTFMKKEQDVKYVDPKHSIEKKKKSKALYYITGIAASLFIGAFLIFSNINTEDEIIYAYINGKPITDKEVAAEYSRQALLAVSQNLDSGTKKLTHLSKLNEVETLIKQN